MEDENQKNQRREEKNRKNLEREDENRKNLKNKKEYYLEIFFTLKHLFISKY